MQTPDDAIQPTTPRQTALRRPSAVFRWTRKQRGGTILEMSSHKGSGDVAGGEVAAMPMSPETQQYLDRIGLRLSAAMGDVAPIAVAPKDLPRLLGLGMSTCKALLASGDIPSRRVGRRRVIPLAGVFRWLERSLTTNGTDAA